MNFDNVWTEDKPRTLDQVKRTFATNNDARWRDLGRADGNIHTNRLRRHLGFAMDGEPVLVGETATMQTIDRVRAQEAQLFARTTEREGTNE